VGELAAVYPDRGLDIAEDVHDVLANDEHAVALCALSLSRGNESVEFPVANVSHIRDGQVTEFWTADPQASIDFWS
jgi:hypothetical protein